MWFLITPFTQEHRYQTFICSLLLSCDFWNLSSPTQPPSHSSKSRTVLAPFLNHRSLVGWLLTLEKRSFCVVPWWTSHITSTAFSCITSSYNSESHTSSYFVQGRRTLENLFSEHMNTNWGVIRFLQPSSHHVPSLFEPVSHLQLRNFGLLDPASVAGCWGPSTHWTQGTALAVGF